MASAIETDATPLHDLTGFQRDLLVVLSDDPGIHGLGLKDIIEEHYGEEINHGRLYPNLDTLVEAGLVGKSEADRRTNEYSLSRRGERELATHLRWERDYAGHLLDEDA